MSKIIYMRLRIIIRLLLVMFLVTQLTGCQLAIEDATIINKSEKLCGILLTIGSDWPSTLDSSLANMDLNVGKNGKITFDEKRLASINNQEVEGQLIDNSTMKFNGVEGHFMGLIAIEENDIISKGLMADPEFHNGKMSVNVTDEGEENSCEITFSVGNNFNQGVHLNPVYQRGDGTYYAIRGGMGMLITGENVGTTHSQTLDNTFTNTTDGIKKQRKDSFKVNIEVVEPSDKIIIKEMNQIDELIKVTEYGYHDPENYTVEHNTDYIIVEEWENDNLDNPVTRSIYSMKNLSNNERISHLWNIPGENNIVIIKEINFIPSK